MGTWGNNWERYIYLLQLQTFLDSFLSSRLRLWGLDRLGGLGLGVHKDVQETRSLEAGAQQRLASGFGKTVSRLRG